LLLNVSVKAVGEAEIVVSAEGTVLPQCGVGFRLGRKQQRTQGCAGRYARQHHCPSWKMESMLRQVRIHVVTWSYPLARSSELLHSGTITRACTRAAAIPDQRRSPEYDSRFRA